MVWPFKEEKYLLLSLVAVVLLVSSGCDEVTRLVDAVKSEGAPEAPTTDAGERPTARAVESGGDVAVEAAPRADPRGQLVSSPDPGSAEAVVGLYIAAAAEKDEAVGWRKLKGLIHSKDQNNVALDGWRNAIFRSSRRKVWLYVQSKDDLSFRLAKREVGQAGSAKLFVYNRESVPTPCTVARDPAVGGAWRIVACSL